MLIRAFAMMAAMSIAMWPAAGPAFAVEATRGVHVPHFAGAKAGTCGRRDTDRIRAVMSGAEWNAFDRRVKGKNRPCA